MDSPKARGGGKTRRLRIRSRGINEMFKLTTHELAVKELYKKHRDRIKDLMHKKTKGNEVYDRLIKKILVVRIILYLIESINTQCKRMKKLHGRIFN